MSILDARLDARAFAEMKEVACNLALVLRRFRDARRRFALPSFRALHVALRLREIRFARRDIRLGLLLVRFGGPLVRAGIGFFLLGVRTRILELFEI